MWKILRLRRRVRKKEKKPPLQPRKRKMNNFFQKRKKEVLVGIIGLVLTLLSLIVWNFARQGYFNKQDDNQVPVLVSCGFRHPLSGACTDSDPFEGVVSLPVYAVMVENSSDAWPQAGLDKAFLVI